MVPYGVIVVFVEQKHGADHQPTVEQEGKLRTVCPDPLPNTAGLGQQSQKVDQDQRTHQDRRKNDQVGHRHIEYAYLVDCVPG
jgi:hypothetical protein